MDSRLVTVVVVEPAAGQNSHRDCGYDPHGDESLPMFNCPGNLLGYRFGEFVLLELLSRVGHENLYRS